MRPWNNWFHCTGCTYGSWLPGDPRGFRTRHHRQHVEGDYMNPPSPGAHAATLIRSKSLMNRGPVRLTAPARRTVCDVFAETFAFHRIDVVIIAVDDHHFHVLARFRDHDPRTWIGHAKRRSARALSEAGLAASGGVWAVRSRAEPIKDRAHQVAVARYIQRHSERGAALHGACRSA